MNFAFLIICIFCNQSFVHLFIGNSSDSDSSTISKRSQRVRQQSIQSQEKKAQNQTKTKTGNYYSKSTFLNSFNNTLILGFH